MQHSGFLALYSALWVWLLAGGFRFRLSLLVRSPLALALLTAQTEHYDPISALGKTSKPFKLLFSETKYKRGPERGVCAAGDNLVVPQALIEPLLSEVEIMQIFACGAKSMSAALDQ